MADYQKFDYDVLVIGAGGAGLRAAIEACRNLGVEIILFNKFTWADSSTEWYKKELFRYAVRDPYGDTYQWGGYSYDTPTQLETTKFRVASSKLHQQIRQSSMDTMISEAVTWASASTRPPRSASR